MVGLFLTGVADRAAACSLQAPESMVYVIATLKGEEATSQAGLDEEPGELVSVWKRETVQTWAAVGEYGRASVSTITEYWGAPPPERQSGAGYSGGHLIGASATSTSCGNDEAPQLGHSEFYLGVFYAESGSTVGLPIEPHPTEGELAELTELLGESTHVPPPEFSEEHPTAQLSVERGSTEPAPLAGEVPAATDSASGFPLIWTVVGSLAVAAGAGTWILRRRSGVSPDQG